MPHVAWELLRPSPDPTKRAVQLAYVEGYVLALEDALKEIEALQASWKGQSFSPYRMALQAAKARLVDLREQAEGTFDQLVALDSLGENFTGEGPNQAS
jgi:hypothetical protein